MISEYPTDYFVEIDGDEHRVGRLTVNKLNTTFSVEVDIVQKESKKIWMHVDILYGKSDQNEALEEGVQKLANFLKGRM